MLIVEILTYLPVSVVIAEVGSFEIFNKILVMKKYYPILLTKRGELTALRHLEQAVKEKVAPIFELLPGSEGSLQQHLIQNWSFDDNEVLIDLSNFGGFTRPTIRSLFQALHANGVNAVPVIQSNSEPAYLTFVQGLVTQGHAVCIRASNATGWLNLGATFERLRTAVGATRNNTILLLDLGYADVNNYNTLAAFAIQEIRGLPHSKSWKGIIVASSSFPKDMSEIKPSQRMHRIPRHEWAIWQAVSSAFVDGFVTYGDYGTKYPFFSIAPYAGTCSIKYTITDEYIIYRGDLTQDHPDGHGQYITFASRLMASAEYSGAAFSWGDREITRIGSFLLTDPNRNTGSAETWVQISQNHHITYLESIL